MSALRQPSPSSPPPPPPPFVPLPAAHAARFDGLRGMSLRETFFMVLLFAPVVERALPFPFFLTLELSSVCCVAGRSEEVEDAELGLVKRHGKTGLKSFLYSGEEKICFEKGKIRLVV